MPLVSSIRRNSWHTCSFGDVFGRLTSPLYATLAPLSFQTSVDFLRAYGDLHTNVPLSSFARLAYDSVWTVAMTLRATQQQQQHVINDSGATFDNFRYQTDSGRELRNTFLDVMGNLEFMGISVGDSEFKNRAWKARNIIMSLYHISRTRNIRQLRWELTMR